MSAEWLALLLRLALVLLIYIFLFQVVVVIRRDLNRAAPTTVKPAGVARLTVVDPGKSRLMPGQAITLTGVNSIGRVPGNAIEIDDEFVSTRHASLAFRDRRWWLEDLGSTNGTFVNGRPVDRRTPVTPGDLVEIGRVRFRFEDA